MGRIRAAFGGLRVRNMDVQTRGGGANRINVQIQCVENGGI